MRHLILWMQAVGVGAGVHREGQHGGAHQVPQEVVQKHTWHIRNVVSMIARSMRPFTRWTSRGTTWCSWGTCWGPSCFPSPCPPVKWSHWPCHYAYNVCYVPCVFLNNSLGDLLSSTMLSFSMYTCSSSYSLHPKYQVWHIKSTYYTWPRSFGDGPMPLKCNLRNFLIVLVKKMSGGELLCTTAARRLKFGIWTLWCIYFDNPLSFSVANHF